MNEPESNDQDFNEAQDDFDFGEQTAEIRSFTHQAPLNKKLPFVIFGIIFCTILGFGYRFYKPRDAAEKIPHIVAEVSQSLPQHTPVKTRDNLSSQDLEQAFAATDTTPSTHSPSVSSSSKPLDTTTPPVAPIQQALFDKPATATVTHPTALSNSENSLSAEMMKQLSQSLDKLNQQIDYIFGKINYLDSYTHEVSQNLDKLNQSIALMDQRLSSLSQTTQTLSADVGGVKNEVSHVKETLKDEGFAQEPIRLQSQPLQYGPSDTVPTQRSTATAPSYTPENPEYLVHAVIPGRAWLKSAKGAIITVAEGDTIGNYGKVLLIDAAHGLVLTSSGLTFR